MTDRYTVLRWNEATGTEVVFEGLHASASKPVRVTSCDGVPAIAHTFVVASYASDPSGDVTAPSIEDVARVASLSRAHAKLAAIRELCDYKIHPDSDPDLERLAREVLEMIDSQDPEALPSGHYSDQHPREASCND